MKIGRLRSCVAIVLWVCFLSSVFETIATNRNGPIKDGMLKQEWEKDPEYSYSFSPAEEHESYRISSKDSEYSYPSAAEETVEPFCDVTVGSYYADAVKWAYSEGITTGTSDTTFDPMGTCTRGQAVTFLWRAAGKPEPVSLNNPFQDIKESDFFYKAVLWAVEQRITNGTSESQFSPGQTCSSAHIITFLYRAMGIGENGWGAESRNWAINAGMVDATGLIISTDEYCPRGAVVFFLFKSYAKTNTTYILGEACPKDMFSEIRTIPFDSKDDAFDFSDWIREYIRENQILLVSDLYSKLGLYPIPEEAYHYGWNDATLFGFGREYSQYYIGWQRPLEIIEVIEVVG